MKLIVYSDIQFEPWQEFSIILPNGLNSRLQDQLNIQDEIFEFAKKVRKTGEVIIIHNGDLFQSFTEKIDKVTFLTVFEKFVQFSREGIPIILLMGNHDFIDKTETSNILEPFKEIDNVLVVDSPWVDLLDKNALSFIPFTRMDFLNKVAIVKKQIAGMENKYLFTHQGVNGAMVGPRDIHLKDEYHVKNFGIDTFDIVFNGHYHKTQTYVNKFIIIGSPIQKDFGERNDNKGFWFLDTEKNPRKPEFIETHGPKFYKMQIDNFESTVWPEMIRAKEDFLWIISKISINEISQYLNSKDIDLNHVRIDIIDQNQTAPRTEISISMGTEEQIEKYINYLQTDLGKKKLLDMALLKYHGCQKDLDVE